MKIIKIILLLVIVVIYATISIRLIVHLPEDIAHGNVHRISNFTPHFTYLIGLSNQTQPLLRVQLRRFIKYYEFLYAHYEQEDYTIQEPLAFCYANLNQKDLAIKLYTQSIKKDPHFFWNYYNLGILYLSQRNLTAAQQFFESAAKTLEKDALSHIMSSNTYLQIILDQGITIADLDASYKNGHKNTLDYLQLLKIYYPSMIDPAGKEKLCRN